MNDAETTKNDHGRPSKYNPDFDRQVGILAEKGFTDKEIASVFGVTEQTVNNWKGKFPTFFESLKSGKEIADRKVVQALFVRACGYSHPEIHINSYEGEILKTDIIKHYPPDVTACIFWLKNRDRKNWRDKYEHDHGVADETLKTVIGVINGGTKGVLPSNDPKDSAKAP